MNHAETQRLREPAAWALIGFVAVGLAVTATRVLFGAGTLVEGLRARAYSAQADLLHVMTPFLLVVAVLLVTHLGRPPARSRLVTRVALAVLGAQALAGLGAALAALTYKGGAFAPVSEGARVQQTVLNITVLGLFALAAYFFLIVLAVPHPPTVTRGRVAEGAYGPPQPPPQPGPMPAAPPVTGAYRAPHVPPPAPPTAGHAAVPPTGAYAASAPPPQGPGAPR
ncbi:hypothetical protein [Yinghuangia soli]|uniref:Uncharacterized protein n=1 Tax=Yinghuangia soli TaxID=2908204 RepID=A0AA41U1P7_9ACTN|nr:hypothetical protein [Yinghuangia soli]MCF2529800.1 hypothetical protein [Yinghuangia soli]